MNKYIAFYGDIFYPEGGMNDLLGYFDSIEDAVNYIKKAHLNNRPDDLKWDWAWGHILNVETKELQEIQQFLK